MTRIVRLGCQFVLLILLGACGLSSGAQSGVQTAGDDADTSLLNADRAWARTTTAEGFMSFLADDAIYVLFHSRVMDGKNEWGPWVDRLFSQAEFVLDWEAARVEVGPSADMGYTAGDWRATWKDDEGEPINLAGSYLAVWERQDDGKWKVIAETEYTGTSLWAPQNSPPE